MIALPELKVELDIDAADTTFDAYLSALEPRAVSFVQNRTGHYFGPTASVTETIIGQGLRELWLNSNVATAPTTVSERQYPGGAATTITASADDGFLVRTSPRNVWLVRKAGGVWRDGYEYEVTWTRGYAAGAEPGEIRQLVIDLIASRFAMRSQGSVGVVSETIGGYSYRMGDFSDGEFAALGPMAADTIAMWTRIVHA